MKAPTRNLQELLWTARRKRWLLAVLAAHLALRLSLCWGGLHNEVVAEGSATGPDSQEYAELGMAIAMGSGLDQLVEHGRRMPGYPALLSIFARHCESPWVIVRIAQLLMSSALILVAGSIAWRLTSSASAEIFAGVLAAIWPPLHYFAMSLLPETASILVGGFLLLIAAGLDRQRRGRCHPVFLGLLVVAATYLKPNQILFVIPALIVLLANSRYSSAWDRTKRTVTFLAVLVFLLLPWSMAVSRAHGGFVPLTTTLGRNLFLGAGAGAAADDGSTEKTLFATMGKRLRLVSTENVAVAFSRSVEFSDAETSRFLSREASQVWSSRPLAASFYGLAKVGHTFGLSGRDPRDWGTILLTIGALAASIQAWRVHRWRSFVLVFWSSTVVATVQSFVFLPNQRFRVILFDLPALAILAAVAWLGIAAVAHKFRDNHSSARPA